MVYSTTPTCLGSVQWTTGELDEDDAQLAGPAARILARRHRVLSGLAPESGQQISRELAALETSWPDRRRVGGGSAGRPRLMT
jgi:hypothetical protein